MSKDALRQKMPTVAAICDEYREWLTGGKVIFAEENGIVIDRREPVDPDCVWTIPADFRPYTPKERK
jgi:hypothetical protein